MEIIKKKDGIYLLVKLDKVGAEYLIDFKKFEKKQHVNDTDKLFSDLFALHVQAVYVMTHGEMLEQDGIVSRKFMNKITSELERHIQQYVKTIRKYMDRFHALDKKHTEK